MMWPLKLQDTRAEGRAEGKIEGRTRASFIMAFFYSQMLLPCE
jgi:hypothetical protein